jgi:fibronectin type 3 domain-containing protein
MKRVALILLVLWGALATLASAQSVALAWDTNANTTGYHLHYGAASRSYTVSVDTKLVTAYTVTGLVPGATYYFAVSAYNATGESPLSNEVSVNTAPVPPSLLRFTSSTP